MSRTTDARPQLTTELSEAEFRRWYWLKSELIGFARSEGFSTSGSKPELADRIAAFLDGKPLPPPKRARNASRHIEGPIGRSTVIPPNQTASQQLRPFFVEEIGSSFRYDHFMRTFLAENAGRTLGDAVDHWYETRGVEPPETLEQLELIRFTKAWHLAHPDGTAAECRAAWRTHRSLPVDRRPGPENMPPARG